MSIVAQDLITRSLRMAGVIASGETPTAPQSNDALKTLNALIGTLSNESMLIYDIQTVLFAMDGSTTYTWGGLGADIESVRPIAVSVAWYRDSEGTDYPLQIYSYDQYALIPDKSETGDIPLSLTVNSQATVSYFYPNPIPDSGEIYVMAHSELPALGLLSTAIDLPTGYDRMLIYGLASELMLEYGLVNPVIEQRFIEAKAALKRTNTNPMKMQSRLPFGRRRGFDLGGFRAGY